MIASRLRLRRRRLGLEVNLTPLIDVVFLLLIFFMVSATFDRLSEVRVELPRAGAEPEARESRHIELTIDREGRYYVDRREVVNTSRDILERALKKARGDRAEVPVVIGADAKTPHQAVITALEAASQAGLTQISFAVARDAAPGP
jgi:biopolymer transport protein ExbD